MRPTLALLVATLLLPPLALGDPNGGTPPGDQNDHFSDPKTIDVLLRPYTSYTNNVGATTDGPMEPTPCGMSATLWYYVELQDGGAGPLLLDTFGSTANTVIAVYSGYRGIATHNLGLLGCNDDAADGGTASELLVVVRPRPPGEGYYVQVGTREGSDPGDIVLNVRGATSPLVSLD